MEQERKNTIYGIAIIILLLSVIFLGIASINNSNRIEELESDVEVINRDRMMVYEWAIKKGYITIEFGNESTKLQNTNKK